MHIVNAGIQELYVQCLLTLAAVWKYLFFCFIMQLQQTLDDCSNLLWRMSMVVSQ